MRWPVSLPRPLHSQQPTRSSHLGPCTATIANRPNMKSALCLLALVLGCRIAGAAVLHAITDELPSTASSQIAVTTQPVRGGKAAFRHTAKPNGEAAELVVKGGAAGEQWYGWSLQLPADFA